MVNATLGDKIAEGVTTTEYTHEEDTEEGSQRLLYYAITANNVAGESAPTGADAVIVGTPFLLPFHESFRNGTPEVGFWWTRREDGARADFQLERTNSFDSDGGSVLYMPWAAGDGSSFNSGKISMEFELLAYNSTIDPENFVQLGTVDNVPGTWTEYSYELPEGTRYFIIHVVSSDCFALCIDDVTFSTIGTSEVKGYNVYRDGTLLATVDSDTRHYVDVCETEGDYTYNVTAIYNEGESEFSNSVTTSVTTAIEDILGLQGEAYDILSVDGKEIARHRTDTHGLQNGVYILRTTSRRYHKILVK